MPILYAPNTNRLIRGKPKTYLASSVSSGASSITVESEFGFSNNDFLIIGTLGEEKTEIKQISDASIDTTIDLGSNLSFDHAEGTVVYLTDYDKVRFYRDTETDIDDASFSNTSALAAAQDIAVDQMESIYDDTTNSTGHGFYQFQNSSDSSTDSASDPIPYTGYDLDAADTIINRALSVTSQEVNPRLKYEDLFRFLNDFIAYANSKNHRWSEAKVLDNELATLSTGDWEISLPNNIARKNDPSAIIGLHINDYLPLRYVTQREWNKATLNLKYTTLSSAASSGDTTLSLTNSSSFADSGSVFINGDVVDYTGNTRSTNTLTGVTGIQSAGHSSGAYVLQEYDQDVPVVYTIQSKGKIRLWPVVSATVNNMVLYIDYFKRLPTVDSLGDKILIQNIQPAIDYVAYRIRKHISGGTLSVKDEDFQQFVTSLQQIIEHNSPGEPGKIILR